MHKTRQQLLVIRQPLQHGIGKDEVVSALPAPGADIGDFEGDASTTGFGLGTSFSVYW